MTGGSETNPDGVPTGPPGPLDRTWTHPSEIGLATRGSSDRRRSSILATGVVIGGLGLLLSGVLLGNGDLDAGGRDQRASATSSPTERIERSVATVLSVQDGTTAMHIGVVLDDDGHLLVPTEAVRDADSVWVSHGSGASSRAELVATDAGSDLGVLRIDRHDGRRPRLADDPPTQGQEVLLVRTTSDGATTRAGRIGSEVLVGELPPERWTHHVVATRVAAGATGSDPHPDAAELVFDDAGRLLGVARPAPGPHGEPGAARTLHPARGLLELADRLVDDAAG